MHQVHRWRATAWPSAGFQRRVARRTPESQTGEPVQGESPVPGTLRCEAQSAKRKVIFLEASATCPAWLMTAHRRGDDPALGSPTTYRRRRSVLASATIGCVRSAIRSGSSRGCARTASHRLTSTNPSFARCFFTAPGPDPGADGRSHSPNLSISSDPQAQHLRCGISSG